MTFDAEVIELGRDAACTGWVAIALFISQLAGLILADATVLDAFRKSDLWLNQCLIFLIRLCEAPDAKKLSFSDWLRSGSKSTL